MSRCAREEAGLAAGERLWKRGKVTTEDLVGGRVMTSGKTSGSFTSSSLTVGEEGGGLGWVCALFRLVVGYSDHNRRQATGLQVASSGSR